MFEYWQSPNLLMFYKMRGYGPEYSVDNLLEYNYGPSFHSYGKRKVNPNSTPRTRSRRLVKPRPLGGKNPRYEARKCKVGDIVYSALPLYKQINGISITKLKIHPYVIVEIDDCFYLHRKKLTDRKDSFCSYISVMPLKKTNGKWILSKSRSIKKDFIKFYSVSINYWWGGVFLTPEEAMGSYFGKR